jgi:ubiquinone/menaquinone biosynthesis C-methylase UbiE
VTGGSDSGPQADLSSWQVEGDAAASYERLLVPALFDGLAANVVESANLAPGARVLDVACGTGVVSRAAATRVGSTGQVVGTDVNEQMLAVARDAGDGVDFREADAAKLPFPDGAFDAVICQQGLQFVPDPRAACQEMRRVLASDGTATVAVWRAIEHSPVFASLADSLERHAGPPAGTIMRSPFQLPDPDEIREIFTTAGFTDVRVAIHVLPVRFASAEQMLEAEVRSSPLAEVLTEEDRLRAVVDDLDDVLHDHHDDQGVVFPIETHVITASGGSGHRVAA